MFKTLYVEEKAYNYPITRQLLQKFKDIPVVTINHYKDIFNRPKQHFAVQKQSMSLILAVRDGQLLYEGPEICQNFGYTNFYYTSFLLNCLFDCEYCFLQGMYQSANIVAFVNTEDYMRSMEEIFQGRKILLAISYDTDLIAFHNIIPYLEYFYDFFAQHPDILVEVRTKSANQSFYNNYHPLENIIMAFTLAPDEIIKKYERHTPLLEARVKAIKTALSKGFKVRLCFDPVFAIPEMDQAYKTFFHYIFSQIDPDCLVDVSYGFFRMPRDFFQRIEKIRSTSLLYAEEYCLKDNIISYPESVAERIKKQHLEIITKYINEKKVFVL
ncbi:MAG TPA: DNA photolyase [Clostridiaceae bacterium]|nr:DNA photolyase [Clostridiaceae bacterium]